MLLVRKFEKKGKAKSQKVLRANSYVCKSFRGKTVKFNPNYNHFQNILRLFDVLPIFLSPEVKRCTIITYKHVIYKFPHDLQNDS